MQGLYLKNRKMFSILCLGFSSGLPLALTGSTLQAWFTQAGVSLKTIGALSLLGLPYVWKFLWAPVLDRMVPPFLGRRRGWVALTQLVLAALLFLMARLNPYTMPQWLGVVALLVVFFSATQDIAVDAYRTDVLQPEERGIGSAVYTFAYRTAMLISGGLALIIADYLGWHLMYEMMAIIIAGISVATYFAPEVPHAFAGPRSLTEAVIDPFKQILSRNNILMVVLFIVTYKIGDALALSLMSNFLLRELGFSLTEVGLAFKVVGLSATILGAFVGGILLIRMSLFRALMLFGIFQAISNFMFMLLALVGKSYSVMVSAIFIESLCSGLSTAAFVVFLMALCDHRFSATQFAVLSALAAIGRVCAGPLASAMVEHLGWTLFFGWTVLLSCPGLIFLTLLRSRVWVNAEAVV